MRLLVLGGTVFLGRAVVEHALSAGHDVTTFNRGRTRGDRPGVLAVRGDRTRPADVEALAASGTWDLVVDTSGYVPAVVVTSARALADRAARYVLVSSISVYPGFPTERIDASSPVHACPPDAEEAEYGPGKAGSERAVVEAFGDRAMLARAGLLLGPHENVGRLTWWLRRIARGGDVLAPGRPDLPIQVVDARDVAAYLCEARLSGPVNVTSPPGSSTYGAMLDACVNATGSDARLSWVPDEVVLQHGVAPWSELPLWAPENDEFAHVWDVEADPARETGLRVRPLARTVTDTWMAMQHEDPVVTPGITDRHGIDPTKERAVLDAWAARLAERR